MKAIKLTKQELLDQIASHMDAYDVMAPVMVDGKLSYQIITDAEQIVFTDQLPVGSAKEAVFPRVEALMKFEKNKVSVVQKIKPILLIGAKPCDLATMPVLDVIFSDQRWQLEDPFYDNRRKALTIVGMGCQEKKKGCFCDIRGIDRSYSDKCDGFLREIEDGFIYEAISDKATPLFFGDNVEAPEQGPAPEATLQITAGEEELFDKMPWEEYTLGCIGCGTCTYVCPTCHCFVLQDGEKNEKVVRSRLWDSCMYPKFTLHGGGHNPRSSKWARFRQRVLHKYVYVRDNFQMTACTGCGRCIRSCPGGINIRRAVEDIQKRLEE
ncbi:MAG: 4Fe-4S dicluster domain-containing protein [Eubacterium sp.]|nr:4Fe-4S dicluster domain-containing protein [Eubacterium sp.]